jgi:hypothetical protein
MTTDKKPSKPMPKIRSLKAITEWLDEPGISAAEWAARRAALVESEKQLCLCHHRGVSCWAHSD